LIIVPELATEAATHRGRDTDDVGIVASGSREVGRLGRNYWNAKNAKVAMTIAKDIAMLLSGARSVSCRWLGQIGMPGADETVGWSW